MSVEHVTQISVNENDFGREAVAVTRGWRDRAVYESASDEEAQNNALIIDGDLAPREDEPRQFKSLKEARCALEGLANQLLVSPEIQTNRENMMRKLQASLLHTRALGGEYVPFAERMQAMGVAPVYVPDSIISGMNKEIGVRLSKYGVEHRSGASDNDRDNNRKAYEKEFVLTDEDEIATTLKKHIEAGKKIGSDIFPDDESELIDPEIVQVPEPWSGYVSTDEQGRLFIKINTSSAYMYTEGELMTLAGHEFSPGHIRQLSKLGKMILQKEVNPFVGTTLLHSEQATQLELFGQLGGALMVNEDAPDIAKIQNIEDFLKTFAYNNISYLVNTPGFSKKDVFERAKLWLPREKDEHLEDVIEQRQNPMLASYLACYLGGAVAALRILRLEQTKRNEVIRAIDKPCTATSIKNKILQAERL